MADGARAALPPWLLITSLPTGDGADPHGVDATARLVPAFASPGFWSAFTLVGTGDP